MRRHAHPAKNHRIPLLTDCCSERGESGRGWKEVKWWWRVGGSKRHTEKGGHYFEEAPPVSTFCLILGAVCVCVARVLLHLSVFHSTTSVMTHKFVLCYSLSFFLTLPSAPPPLLVSLSLWSLPFFQHRTASVSHTHLSSYCNPTSWWDPLRSPCSWGGFDSWRLVLRIFTIKVSTEQVLNVKILPLQSN